VVFDEIRSHCGKFFLDFGGPETLQRIGVAPSVRNEAYKGDESSEMHG